MWASRRASKSAITSACDQRRPKTRVRACVLDAVGAEAKTQPASQLSTPVQAAALFQLHGLVHTPRPQETPVDCRQALGRGGGTESVVVVLVVGVVVGVSGSVGCSTQNDLTRAAHSRAAALSACVGYVVARCPSLRLSFFVHSRVYLGSPFPPTPPLPTECNGSADCVPRWRG